MAVEHGMDGAFGWDGNAGESPKQTLANFSRAPGAVLALYVQDEILHLKRKSVGVAIGTAAPVRQPLNTAILIAIKDLIAGRARDADLSAEFRHRLAG